MKKILAYILVIIIIIATLAVCIYKYRQTMEENDRLKNNLEYFYFQGSENIALRYTIKELNNTKDSLLIEILYLRDSLGLKKKQTKQIVYVKQTITDTVITEVPVDYNFCKVVDLNELTSIEVCREDSSLMVIPNINNEQVLFVQSEPVYKYKNFFSRLIHFNFKKTNTYRYYIENSNSLIDVCGSLIVNVED